MATSREELGKEAGAGAQVEGRNRQLDVETADRDGSRAGRNVRRRTDERTAIIQTSHRWRFVMGQFYFHIRTGDEAANRRRRAKLTGPFGGPARSPTSCP